MDETTELRRLLAAKEQERDRIRALLIDAWNNGEHANFCPVENGSEPCICWRAEVDAYLKGLPEPYKHPLAAAIARAEQMREALQDLYDDWQGPLTEAVKNAQAVLQAAQDSIGQAP
jgi:hypothetical protein